VAFLFLSARAGAAEPRLPRPASSALFRQPPPGASSDTLHLPRTYARRGALIVGIPSAIFGAAAGIGLCHLNDSAQQKDCTLSALGFGAFLGGIGALTGALIGGQFERH
ncbi:MAG: hypothetical protein JF590_01980, partial [Gemmatimonadetes bacterium]|nr:hypothetical protein [Gemmatimonadota bacterium]